MLRKEDEYQKQEWEKFKKIMEKHDLSNFQGSSDKAAHYYFKWRQKLYMQGIYMKTDIQKKKADLKDLEERKKFLFEAKLKMDSEKKVIQPPEIKSNFTCKQEKCHKTFKKASQLQLHSVVSHSPQLMREGEAVFEILLHESSDRPHQDAEPRYKKRSS